MNASQILGDIRAPVSRKSSWLTQTWAVFWIHSKMLSTYKTELATEILSVAATVAVYFFAGFLVRRARLAELGYGPDYLSFALLGIATADFARITLVRLSGATQQEIRTGTFEVILFSRISLSAYLTGQSIRGMLLGSLYFSTIILAGLTVYGVKLNSSIGAIGYASLLMVLTAAANFGLGLVTAGITLVYKRANTVARILGNLMQFLSGVIYPLRLLEDYLVLHYASLLLPYTYGLDGIRKVLLTDIRLDSPVLLASLGALVVFVATMLPLGSYLFTRSYDRMRREGSTGTY